MKKALGRWLAASMAMASLSAPALADSKVTNGAACVPIVTSSNVPSTETVVTKLGARMSTQVVAGDSQARALTFVCPLVRDVTSFPVSLSMKVNTFNAAGAGDFACNMKIVAEDGALVDNQLVYVGHSSRKSPIYLGLQHP